MFIILLLIIIGIIAVLVTYVNDPTETLFATLMSSGIIGIIIVLVMAASYETYLDTRAQYDAVINQYKGAVTMYADYASLDMEKATFTDFRYQGYQDNIARVIIDLRGEIVEYNRVLIKKKIMDASPVFSWLIIAPDDDMKIINIVE